MLNDTRTTLTLLAGAVILCTVPAVAQTPTPTPAMKATIQARHISRITGSVRAEPEGKFTRVTVMFNAPRPTSPQALTLMNGAQCTDRLNRTASMIALNPPQGNVSSTIVQIPFSAFSSGSYVVDIRNATSNAQLAEACARFGR
jgi:hypothetical protein